ncbi:NACHT domain-containing protein [Actinoplanes sp. NPDC051861]|uniref:NACHT domain-containing protein n=1 Tax=Actinoplanes sp. NPDC051861 TaxID=3155170 RepID=UPI003413843F
MIDEEVVDSRDRQRLRREIADIEETIRERLLTDVASSGTLSESERATCIEIVVSCLTSAQLSEHDYDIVGMNAADLAAIVEERGRDRIAKRIHTLAGRVYFTDVLIGTSAILLATIAAGPSPSPYVFATLLREPGGVSAAVRRSIGGTAIPATQPENGSLYLRTLVTALDQGELIGFTLAESLRRFRLSGVYTEQTVVVEDTELNADIALADSRRLHILGVAGSGKTTMLCRLAVACARDDLPESLVHLRGLLPVYVPARRLTRDALRADSAVDVLESAMHPGPEGLLDPGTVGRTLADGRALVLIDGMDEVTEDQRMSCSNWLRSLVTSFPDCRYVVSSRTGSAGDDTRFGPGFVRAQIRPLTERGVATLVHRWFTSAGEPGKADELLDLVRRTPQLSELVTLPLLCAVICAVYGERGARALQGGDIYEALLEMLVERRDVERGLPAANQLPRSLSLLFLEEMAGHMVRNDIREWTTADAEEFIGHLTRSMSRDLPEPDGVLNHLVDRSGVLIKPAPDVVGFLHVTFLDFLAARHFVLNDEITLLADNAHRPTWRRVVAMAAPQLRPKQGEYLLRRLLTLVIDDEGHRPALASLLQQCVDAVPRLDPELRNRVEDVLGSTQIWGDDVWIISFSSRDMASHHAVAEEMFGWIRQHTASRPDVVINNGALPQTLRAAGRLALPAVLEAVVEWRTITARMPRPAVTVRGAETRITIADDERA